MSKLEKIVEVAARKATIRTEVTILCDICSKPVGNKGYGWRGECSICNRDVCRDHCKYDPHEPGDYPDNYCSICYDIKYIRYGDRYSVLVERHWKEKETLDMLVKEESLITPDLWPTAKAN